MKELKILVDCAKITGTGSSTEKQRLLSTCKTETMEWLLQIAANPFLTTKISKLNISQKESQDNFEDIKNKINHLTKSKAAKDEDRKYLEDKISNLNCSIEEKEMLVKILTKNFNIGIGVSLINKVFGKNFIPDLELMAAQDDMSLIDSTKTNYAEIKYDGVRVIAVYKDNLISFYTRNFNELNSELMPSIYQEVEKFAQFYQQEKGIEYPIFIDGELTDANRKSVSGKVNQILKGKTKEPLDNDFIFNIFDIGNFSWITQDIQGDKTYVERRAEIDFVFDNMKFNHLLKAEMYKVSSKQEINDLFSKVVSKGGEGLIIKTANHKYECKRSKNWIKLKEVNDCDLKITGWFDGENKRKDNGWIGGFICESDDEKLKVSVGSGFTEDMLTEYSKNPQSYVGKIAKIQYNTKIQDKHGSNSLFLPVFLEIRSDKDKANTFDEIK